MSEREPAPRAPDRAAAEPDPVALDELLRAFAIEVPDDTAPAPRRTEPAGGSAGDPTDEPTDDPNDDRTDEEIDRELDAAVDEVLAPDTPDAATVGGADRADPAGPDPVDPGDPEESVTVVRTTRAPSAAAGTPTAAPRKVVTIDDGDRPDAVYLKGELASDTSGGTDISGGSVVFIDDDDTGDAEVPGGSGPIARRIEPRFRERRIAVRRAEGRRRLRWFVVAGGVALLVVAVLAVLGSPLFAVDADRVTVTGAVYADPERLQAVVDDLVGTPVLIADTQAAERELEEIPWVADARVRTSFPNSASIEIRERRALATFQGPDGRFRVIDRDGRVLDVIDGQPIAYMLVTGPDATDVPAGGFAAPGYASAASLVQGLTSSVRGRVTSIDVTADGSQLTMFLAATEPSDGTPPQPAVEVRFGAANDLLTKLVRLETVLPIATERGATLIDVSTAEVTVQ